MSPEVAEKAKQYHAYFQECYAEVGGVGDHIQNEALSKCLNRKLNLIKENGDVNADEVRLLYQTITNEEKYVEAATNACVNGTVDRARQIRICFDLLRHPYKIAFLV